MIIDSIEYQSAPRLRGCVGCAAENNSELCRQLEDCTSVIWLRKIKTDMQVIKEPVTITSYTYSITLKESDVTTLLDILIKQNKLPTLQHNLTIALTS